MNMNFFDDEFEVPGNIQVDSPITDYFRGKCVFLTGGTGHLGYLFIEKLLRINVKRLYILIRPRRDKTAAERLEEIFKNPVFRLMKKTVPDFRDRVFVVEGDLLKINLGISDARTQDLHNNVDVVIHSASDIRFSLTAHEIAKTNVCGTYKLLELCRNMKGLQAFLYVSTAFSQNREKTDDRFYPAKIEPKTVIEYIETRKTDADCELFNIAAEKFLIDSKNTYMFSKNIAEALVHDYGEYFPCAVIRPSVVYSTFRDPITAWISKNSILGLWFSAVLIGQLRCLLLQKNAKIPIVCADMVISASLSIIWFTSREHNRSIFTPQVYNISNRSCYELIGQLDKTIPRVVGAARKSLSAKTFRYPAVQSFSRGWLYTICALCFEVIPSVVIDFLNPNKEQSLLKFAKGVSAIAVKTNQIFGKNFVLSYKNLDKVYERMTLYDKCYYNFNTQAVDWKHFLNDSIVALRAYILDESVDAINDVKKTERKAFWLKLAYYTFNYLAIIALFFVACYMLEDKQKWYPTQRDKIYF